MKIYVKALSLLLAGWVALAPLPTTVAATEECFFNEIFSKSEKTKKDEESEISEETVLSEKIPHDRGN